MFRNFDGANGSFGDTSIRATTSDLANATVYASVDAGNADRMVLVCINKNDARRPPASPITHTVQFHTAQGLPADQRQHRAAAAGRTSA